MMTCDVRVDLGGIFISVEEIWRQARELFPECEYALEHGGKGRHQEVIDDAGRVLYRCEGCGLRFVGIKD